MHEIIKIIKKLKSCYDKIHSIHLAIIYLKFINNLFKFI